MNLSEFTNAVMIITPSITAFCCVVGYLVCRRMDTILGCRYSLDNIRWFSTPAIIALIVALTLWCVGALVVYSTSDRALMRFGVAGMIFSTVISITLVCASCIAYHRVFHVNDNDRHGS